MVYVKFRIEKKFETHQWSWLRSLKNNKFFIWKNKFLSQSFFNKVIKKLNWFMLFFFIELIKTSLFIVKN